LLPAMKPTPLLGVILLGLAAWLLATVVLSQIGFSRLSNATFWVGGNVLTVVGLLLVRGNPHPARVVRHRIVYISISASSLAALSFAYSYLTHDAVEPFYLGVAFMIIGTSGTVLGVRTRTRKSG